MGKRARECVWDPLCLAQRSYCSRRTKGKEGLRDSLARSTVESKSTKGRNRQGRSRGGTGEREGDRDWEKEKEWVTDVSEYWRKERRGRLKKDCDMGAAEMEGASEQRKDAKKRENV